MVRQKECVWCGRKFKPGEKFLDLTFSFGLHPNCRAEVEAESDAIREAEARALALEVCHG